MGRLAKTGKSSRIAVDIDAELADAVRQTVAATRGMTLCGFAQAAFANYLRGHRPVMEYVTEMREKKGRSTVKGGLDPKLDRPDGIPLATTTFTERNWKINWPIDRDPRKTIDALRAEQGREAMTDSEWQQVVKYMGSEPGGGK